MSRGSFNDGNMCHISLERGQRQNKQNPWYQARICDRLLLFKMAAATPDVPITQLLDKIATKFQRL